VLRVLPDHGAAHAQTDAHGGLGMGGTVIWENPQHEEYGK